MDLGMAENNSLEELKGKRRARSDTGRLRLNNRDYKIMSALEVWGVLGLGQLASLVFYPKALNLDLIFNRYGRRLYDGYAYKRVFRLEKAGYIKACAPVQSLYREPNKAYVLAIAGQKKLVEAGRSEGIPAPRKWSPSAVSGYLLRNAYGLLLVQISNCAVSPRHQLLWLNRGRYPDQASLRMGVPDFQIAGEKTPIDLWVEIGPRRSYKHSSGNDFQQGTENGRPAFRLYPGPQAAPGSVNSHYGPSVFTNMVPYDFEGELLDLPFRNSQDTELTLRQAIFGPEESS